MAKEILHYEVTRSYGKITKGLRFDVEKDNTAHIDKFIKEGLSEATGIPINQLPAISNLGLEEI